MITGLIIWMIGFLFMLGIAIEESTHDTSVTRWEWVGMFFILLLMWPILLGQIVCERVQFHDNS